MKETVKLEERLLDVVFSKLGGDRIANDSIDDSAVERESFGELEKGDTGLGESDVESAAVDRGSGARDEAELLERAGHAAHGRRCDAEYFAK